jgi:hypothetical protein
MLGRVLYEKWSNKWVKILKFWRTELSYAQNKQSGEKERLLGIDTCPSLNDIMEIRCIKCNRSELYYFIIFLILTCSCQYSNNLMLTATCMFRSYILLSTRQETPKLLKSYTCSLRLHLMHLISIISFKLGHVSIPKRRSLSSKLLILNKGSRIYTTYYIYKKPTFFSPLTPCLKTE